MRTLLLGTAVFAALSIAPFAEPGNTHAGVAGTWEMVVKGPAAHGDLTATMDLKQDGKKVTGSFAAHGNTHTIAGEFTNGELALQTTDTPADKGLTLNARLKDDGTLAGYLSSGMGDMQWTATRQAAKK